MKRWLLIALVMVAGCGGSDQRILVAAGTTLVDSGFIEQLANEYTAETGVEVDVIGEATAQVLSLARSRTVDVTITHAPDLEAEFQSDGLASQVVEAFSSRFIVLGPSDAEVFVGGGVETVFAAIAEQQLAFVGREDGSGTSVVERSIWEAIGVSAAAESWYLATGQGMGLTLQVASERQAFVLAELGSALSAGNLDLFDVGVIDERLENPYTAMSVAASDADDLADAFVLWLNTDSGRKGIEKANMAVFSDPDVYKTP